MQEMEEEEEKYIKSLGFIFEVIFRF